MFISGTLGTVIGDFCSHNMGLDDAGASILLSPIVAVLFLAGRGGRLLLLPFYWLTVVLIRAAGTAVGDFISVARHAAVGPRIARGRVTAGDGGGHDDAGMRRVRNHKSRASGRRSR